MLHRKAVVLSKHTSFRRSAAAMAAELTQVQVCLHWEGRKFFKFVRIGRGASLHCDRLSGEKGYWAVRSGVGGSHG